LLKPSTAGDGMPQYYNIRSTEFHIHITNQQWRAEVW